jgi:hypothetical protein
MGIGTGTAALIGGVASAGAGIAGSAIQAGAATSAAQTQAAKAQQAMNIAGTNLQSAVQPQYAATGAIQSAYGPYLAASQQGLGQLGAAMPSVTAPYTQQFQAPTAAQAAATPGYQFALQQGLNAIQSGAAAQGNLLTGGTQKNLANYATGLASQTYQQTYNNALAQYQNNYNVFANNQANMFNRLMGYAGLGAGMTGQYGALTQQGAQNLAGIYGQNTAAMANLLGTQGAAQAAGTMGAGQAWSQGLGGIGQTASNLGLINMLTGGGIFGGANQASQQAVNQAIGQGFDFGVSGM